MNKMVNSTIVIPKKAGNTYVREAFRSKGNDNLPIECLAYFIGYEDNNTRTVTEVLFPNQTGSAGKVDDNGKTKE